VTSSHQSVRCLWPFVRFATSENVEVTLLTRKRMCSHPLMWEDDFIWATQNTIPANFLCEAKRHLRCTDYELNEWNATRAFAWSTLAAKCSKFGCFDFKKTSKFSFSHFTHYLSEKNKIKNSTIPHYHTTTFWDF